MITFIAVTAVSSWFWAGLTWHADRLRPATARTLLAVASFWGPVLNGATITMLAPVVALSWGAYSQLPRWLGALGAVPLVILARRGIFRPARSCSRRAQAGLPR